MKTKMLSGKRTSIAGGVGTLPSPKRSTYQYTHTRLLQSYEPCENSTAGSAQQASQTLSNPEPDNATIHINKPGNPPLETSRLDDIDDVRNDELSHPPLTESSNCTDKATYSVRTETDTPGAAITRCFGMVFSISSTLILIN
jgi:hypothetical protein